MMTSYNATVVVEAEWNEADVERWLANPLATLGGLAAGADDRGRARLTITIPTTLPSLALAATSAVAVVEAITLSPACAVEVMPTDAFDADYRIWQP